MKHYLHFRQSSPNYSLHHNFNSVFKRIELGIFGFLCIILLITSKINEDFTKKISMNFVGISLPIVKFSAFPFNLAINLLTDFSDLIEAKKENETLKKENEELRSFYITSLNIHRENKELKNTLRFINSKSTKYTVAHITGRSHQVFNQQLFVNVGSSNGVKEGSIVSGTHGVIGRIAEVGENRSRIILANDANSRIPIITSKARVRGILAGDNSNIMEILYLQKTHNIQEGDWVFTSGDGDTLPSGLLIGVVRKVDKGYAAVEMVENVSNSDIVTIIDY